MDVDLSTADGALAEHHAGMAGWWWDDAETTVRSGSVALDLPWPPAGALEVEATEPGVSILGLGLSWQLREAWPAGNVTVAYEISDDVGVGRSGVQIGSWPPEQGG